MRLFASLRERARTDRIVVDGLREGLTLGELKAEIARRHPALGDLAHVAGVVGTAYANDARVLAAGDDVALLPPVSGGAPESDPEASALERGLFELCPERIDPARAQERVADPACGAIAVFTGTTRATNRGRAVVRLDYEAFEAMTGPEMERIFARCRADVLAADPVAARARMLVQHRVGTVPVGEPSVVIAVASPHRAAAFAACRYLIDELKASLPIWKKEVYEDGHAWIGDRS